jgi:hypothetical protein
MEENIDYYINEDGNFVFTEVYHLKRGYCCQNKCKHCPGISEKPTKRLNHGKNKDICILEVI